MQVPKGALVQAGAVRAGPGQPGGDRARAMAEEVHRGCHIEPSASALSTSPTRYDAVLSRYSGVTQRVPAAGAEGSTTCLAAQGLSAFGLAMPAVAEERMDLRICDPIGRRTSASDRRSRRWGCA
jgi:hypothetical protein